MKQFVGLYAVGLYKESSTNMLAVFNGDFVPTSAVFVATLAKDEDIDNVNNIPTIVVTEVGTMKPGLYVGIVNKEPSLQTMLIPLTMNEQEEIHKAIKPELLKVALASIDSMFYGAPTAEATPEYVNQDR